MASEAQILSGNYGVSPAFAESLLSFTKGDLESAIRILESSEKDLLTLKAKFISSKKMTNGALILFFNFQSGLPEYIFSVVSANQNLGKLKLEGSWKEFIEEMLRFLGSVESDPEASSRIESQILSQDNVRYISTFFADRQNIDMVNIRRFMLSEISKVMMDTGIVLKVITEYADLFRFYNYLSDTKFGLRAMNQSSVKTGMIINMKVEPILTPIGGIDVDKIAIGDEVCTKIADTREIVSFIKDLMVQSEDTERAVWGRVVKTQRNQGTETNGITLEFGPGIFGTFVMGGKIKISARQKGSKTESQIIQSAPLSAPKKEAAEPWQNSNAFTALSRDDKAEEKKQNNNILVFAAIAIAVVVLIAIIWINLAP